MRHLNRTHGVCISWLKENNLFYERSAKQSGDIYTKMFYSADNWAAVCYLINVINPTSLCIAEMNYFLNHWDGTTPEQEQTTPCVAAQTTETHMTVPTSHKTGGAQHTRTPVSYTHLTLPTIYSV